MILVALCSESSQLLARTHSYRRCYCFRSDSVTVQSISIMAVCHISLVETVAVWVSIKFFFSVIVESTENLCEICVLLEICVKYFGAKHKYKTHTRLCSFLKQVDFKCRYVPSSSIILPQFCEVLSVKVICGVE